MTSPQADFFNHYIPMKRFGTPIPIASEFLSHHRMLAGSAGFIRFGPHPGVDELKKSASIVGSRMLEKKLEMLPSEPFLKEHRIVNWTPFVRELDVRWLWATASCQKAFSSMIVTRWLTLKLSGEPPFPDRMHETEPVKRDRPPNPEIMERFNSLITEKVYENRCRNMRELFRRALAPAGAQPSAMILGEISPGTPQQGPWLEIARRIDELYRPDRPLFVSVLESHGRTLWTLAGDLGGHELFDPESGQFRFSCRKDLVTFLLFHVAKICHSAERILFFFV